MAVDDSNLPRQMPLEIPLYEKHQQLLVKRKESFPLRPAGLPYVCEAICISCLRVTTNSRDYHKLFFVSAGEKSNMGLTGENEGVFLIKGSID